MIEQSKEEIIRDVVNQIQSRTSWGKNIIKDMIFKKLVGELTCWKY